MFALRVCVAIDYDILCGIENLIAKSRHHTYHDIAPEMAFLSVSLNIMYKGCESQLFL
jgi:hypothetical protein